MKKTSIVIMALMLALVLTFAGCSGESKSALGVPEKVVSELSEIVALDEVVGFGQYEQDNNTDNGKEAIEWRIVAKDDTKALLVCETAIEAMAYDAEGEKAWESSSVREWLNGELIKTAFNAGEVAKMLDTAVANEAFGDANTTDKIFLLDAAQITEYLAGNLSVRASDYAAANGAWNDNSLSCRWWVRYPAADSGIATAAYVEPAGVAGVDAAYDMVGVRPAVWVAIK